MNGGNNAASDPTRIAAPPAAAIPALDRAMLWLLALLVVAGARLGREGALREIAEGDGVLSFGGRRRSIGRWPRSEWHDRFATLHRVTPAESLQMTIAEATREEKLPGNPPPLGSLQAIAARGEAEALVREFAASLDDAQRGDVCFDYDHIDADRGLLRAFVSNHWQVTRPPVRGHFFRPAQQALIHAIFRALLSADAYPRVLRQLEDDCLGHPWGTDQSVALFGEPSSGPFEFVFSGRHITLRADGGSDPRVAFGGPILYAHTVRWYVERPHHPDNLYWPEAAAASHWHAALPPELAARAVVQSIPPEPPLGFRTAIPGLPLAEVDADHFAAVAELLERLLGRFRDVDRARVRRCLEACGGLTACSIQFALDGRMSAPQWDNWRLEGPAFIWHWRGFPHVHAWVHVASDPGVVVNAAAGARLFPGQDPLPQALFPFR